MCKEKMPQLLEGMVSQLLTMKIIYIINQYCKDRKLARPTRREKWVKREES